MLSQLPAKVSSTEHCTGAWWRGQSGLIRADMVSACRGMLCVGEIVASLCCGLVIREAVGVV